MKKSSSQRVINQNVSKTLKKLKTVNRELSSLAMYDLSDHVSKQKRENRFSKFKQIQQIETTKNEISSHIGNICSICRIDKLQNEKHCCELFNNRKSLFLNATDCDQQISCHKFEWFMKSCSSEVKIIRVKSSIPNWRDNNFPNFQKLRKCWTPWKDVKIVWTWRKLWQFMVVDF